MALNLARLAQDWPDRYGHLGVLAESFVDLQWFRGKSYMASDWPTLGTTAGFVRMAQDHYQVHERLFPPQYQMVDQDHGTGRMARDRSLGGNPGLSGAD